VLVGATLHAWTWARRRGRFAVAAAATLAGWTAWKLVLSENSAASLDVDAPVIALTWPDVGSGVGAFVLTALALGRLDRSEPAGRVVGAAAIAGAIAVVFDILCGCRGRSEWATKPPSRPKLAGSLQPREFATATVSPPDPWSSN
jgi:hypothetical protein